MEKVYSGNTPGLYELFLKGEQLQYKHCNEGNWVDIPKYKGKPDDIYRVAGEYHLFRVKPEEVITKAYMHYNTMEELIQKGDFHGRHPYNYLWGNNRDMVKHLEFTFTNGKLTKVEMKEATS